MEQLNTYIQQARQQGQTDEQIRQSLLNSGWSVELVNSALVGPAFSSASVSQPYVYQNSSSTQDVMPTSTANQLETTSSPLKNKKKLLVFIVPIVLIVIAAVIILALTHSKSNSGSEMSATQSLRVNVSASWKDFNTGFGYSVKAPSSWSLGDSSNSNSGGLSDNSITLSANGGTFSTSTTQAQMNDSITVGTQRLTSNSSQAAFDKEVSSLSPQIKAELKAFGIDVSKAKVTATNLSINGKPWLKVTTYIPGQYSTNLYYWDSNHAIALIVANQSQQVVQQLTNNYLLPAAASMQIKS